MTAPAQPKWMTISGWILTLLVTAALIMSGVMKFSNDPQLLEGLEKMRLTHEVVKKIMEDYDGKVRFNFRQSRFSCGPAGLRSIGFR